MAVQPHGLEVGQAGRDKVCLLGADAGERCVRQRDVLDGVVAKESPVGLRRRNVLVENLVIQPNVGLAEPATRERGAAR